MTTTAGIIWPEVRLYGPDGSNQVQCPVNGSTDWSEINSCVLSANGTYTIYAGAFRIGFFNGNPNTGPYSLTLTGGPPVYDPLHPVSDPNHPIDYPGDPVNSASGDFFHSHTDIAIPGRGVPLSFTRYYHSGSTINHYLGNGWTHSYDMYLEFPAGGVKVFYPDGHAVVFTLSGGNYVPRAGVFDTLVQN